MLQLGDMRTSASLQPDIVRFLSPLRILVSYFPHPTVAKYNESLSWFFALMDPAPGNRFPVFASVHWLVFMLNNLFPITFIFQPLLCPVSTPLPPLFDCVWSQRIRGDGGDEAITIGGSEAIKKISWAFPSIQNSESISIPDVFNSDTRLLT